MTGNNQATQNMDMSSEQSKQVFTFFVEDMMFGLDVDRVLMLDQDISKIQRLPVEERGFQGVTKFQGTVVPVLDFAHRIGVPSGMDNKAELLEVLSAREQDHIEWLNALEHSVVTDAVFTKTLNPDECAFGKWYKKFETRDETLRELMTMFDEPHRQIHGLGETLLTLRDQGKTDKALEILKHEKATTLRKLRTLFSRARDQVESAMRQVLLFVTLDGKSPLYALVIDEINDVLQYEGTDFHASHDGPLKHIMKIDKVIDGIYTKADTPDCIYFDVQKIVDVEQLGSVNQ